MTKGLLSTDPNELVSRRKGEERGDATIHKFPQNLGAHGTLMEFFTYSYGGVRGSEKKPRHRVMLPLPKQINDSFKINIGGNEIGIFGTGAAQVSNSPAGAMDIAKNIGNKAMGSITSGVNAISDVVTGEAKLPSTNALQDALSTGVDVTNYLAKAGLGKVSPDLLNGVSAGTGTTLNPFQTLVFGGIDLKVHSLEWVLSPESEEEQRELQKIIRIIQNNILPEATSPLGASEEGKGLGLTSIDKGIMRYPSMVNVYLQGVDQEYYFKFKTSMISQFNVDYTPNGVAINKGGKPSTIRITMTLNEAFIHTKADADLGVTETKSTITESLVTLVEDSVDDTISGVVNAIVPTAAPTQASDEVVITRKETDGSTVTTTQTEDDVIAATGKTKAELLVSINPTYSFLGGF